MFGSGRFDSGRFDSGKRLVRQLLGPSPQIWGGKASSLTQWPDVVAHTPEQLRDMALYLHKLACRDRIGYTVHDAVLTGLAELEIPWRAADLAWCLTRQAAVEHSDQQRLELELPSAIAARLPKDELADFEPALAALLEEVVSDHNMAMDRRRRVVARLGKALEHVGGDALPGWILNDSYALGVAVREALGDRLRGRAAADLLAHCLELGSVTPNAKWRKRVVEFGDRSSVATGILEVFAEVSYDLTEDDDRIIRALLWIAADDPSGATTDLIARVTTVAGTAPADNPGYPHAPRAAVAGVEILATRGGDQAVSTLARMSLSVRNKALLTRVRSALARIGSLRGWSLSEVMELAIDDHGLDTRSQSIHTISGYVVTVGIVGEKARLSFARDGKPLKAAPAALKDKLKPLRELAKRIDATLTAERLRVEGLLSEEREWAWPDWVERYLEHPVTSAFGRRLIWIADGAAGLAEKRDGGWVLRGLDGETVTGSRVRLWHPARAGVEEVRRWRDHVMATELRQPFKQAFREVYLLTPAEEQTSVYSNRFAAHILRYRQANALMRVRGWHATYLGPWSSGYESEATKEFGGGAWRASFFHNLVPDRAARAEATYCSTDQVRFARRDGADWVQAPVTEVPALVFSEAMRDVDLFVGVTSIAADPQWVDHGEDRFQDYWHATSFGELTASAEIRREALARLLPRTKLAGVTELGERFLRVLGKRKAYRIHLGSGNILMEPNDAYLCIVASVRKPGTIHLPFEEDHMLSLILSKAFLLAADDKIKDETILRQIRG